MKRLCFVAVLALAGLLPLAAAAALIVPVSQTRTVSAFADVDPGDPSSSSYSAADFGTFDQSASATSYHAAGPGWYVSNSVRQTSTIGEDRLIANVRASVMREIASGTAYTESVYDITFDLLEPANYQLGNGQIISGVLGGFGYGSHVVTLRDANGAVISQPAWGMYVPGSSDFLGWASVVSGLLQPGRYRLTAEWDLAYPVDPNTWNAGAMLIFTPIPEPGTALLLALGLGALAMRRSHAH